MCATISEACPSRRVFPLNGVLAGFPLRAGGAMHRGMAELVSRDEELRLALASLDELPAAVVLTGEAGIGKTSIWRAALAELDAQGFRVLATRPAESESQLSYVGLADILDPVLDEVLIALPSPQRRALEVALQRAEPERGPPDQAAIAFAVLGTLRAATETAAVVVAIDDMQWLDPSSLFALAFVAGRLRDEKVGFLLTLRREPSDQPSLEIERRLGEERVQRIGVGPLSLGALHHLVQARLGIAFSRPTLQRMHETSGGNPFFALELARAIHQRGGDVSAGEPLPVPLELRALLRARLATLPREAEKPLLAAASLSSPTLPVVAAVVGTSAVAAIKEATAAELVELEGDRIRFAHPLLASAVYFGVNEERRRAVHRRLAAVVTDPEERARHLALSVTVRDAAVAEALDHAAEAARRRGAPQAAAELAERALELTPTEDTVRALERQLTSGALRFEAGETVRARKLLKEAAEHAPPGPRRAEALSRLARVHLFEGDRRSSVELCRCALAEVGDELEIHSELEEGLAVSYYFMRENLVAAAAHARSAVDAARELGTGRALAEGLAAQGLVDGLLGRASATAVFEEALQLEHATEDLRIMRRPSYSHAVYLFWAEDLLAARARFERLHQHALERGDESSLPLMLAHLSGIECLLGDWDAATRWANESVDAAVQTGQAPYRSYALAARALVNAYLGNEERVRAEAAEALALAQDAAEYGSATSCAALGLLELSRDDAGAAHATLAPLVEKCEAEGIVEPGALRFVPDEIEALILLGERKTARALLERFEERAERLGRRGALAAAARCRGLVAASSREFDAAFSCLRAALDAYAELPLPFERARTLLALGSAQRRARERRAARESLEETLTLFHRLGASLWAERTRRELRRISGRASSSHELTPAEQRVAELVAEGMTNREVAAALYVTPRTVEGTLSRVYTKLGVRSRTELARRLATPQK
jgi:DNA-binding NarL/FixJ family response regulator